MRKAHARLVCTLCPRVSRGFAFTTYLQRYKSHVRVCEIPHTTWNQRKIYLLETSVYWYTFFIINLIPNFNIVHMKYLRLSEYAIWYPGNVINIMRCVCDKRQWTNRRIHFKCDLFVQTDTGWCWFETQYFTQSNSCFSLKAKVLLQAGESASHLNSLLFKRCDQVRLLLLLLCTIA